ncbi:MULTISPECIES: electron transport complex subunit RsxC [unclassified Pseudoalteromonas]|uniref:electron transport complex subunit RsxC n=1 Tax=unclassified Pseudoalteromonas TaxID=194690 RepID=UPI0009E3CD7B|nr:MULTISPECIES: electron transport complex subunit RsxC [unclassified Pseudoalteromonas]
MESLLEQIERGMLWQAPGGVHPPGHKELTEKAEIAQLPLPDKLVIPIKQHIGVHGKVLVEKGQLVLKGQALTEPNQAWSVPIHAPTSGIIDSIKAMPSAHPSALEEISIILIPDGKDIWCDLFPVADYKTLENQDIITKIQMAGISGMGGAGFPTYVKSQTDINIEFLIVNGVECEPYITADDRLMQEYADDIIQGINVLNHVLKPEKVLIAIEDDKPLAIKAMEQASASFDNILVSAIPTKYPSGGEKQLIQILTNKEVPARGIPADIGILVQNVGTLFAINEAIHKGKPLIERVITVTGRTLNKPKNVWALIGSEIKHLLDNCDFEPEAQQRVIMGGPMMGFTLPSIRIPVVKTTNCILAPNKIELPVSDNEQACIRCSACADACPASLLPQQLQWFAKAKEFDKLEEHNLSDCIECGACNYVCPSEIPLVQYYRIAKAQIKEQKEEQQKAQRAKERFEIRNQRLEREKEERLNRHKKPVKAKTTEEQTKIAQAMAKVKSDRSEKSAVSAAIARAKAKKLQSENEAALPDNSEVAKQRAERKEKARLYREEKQKNALNSDTDIQDNTSKDSDKKSAVAAAIARAKAKKLAKQAEQTPELENNSEQIEDPRKAAVAAAVARAKAKKLAKQAEQAFVPENNSEQIEDPRKAAVAAAVARAKAKKLAKQAEQASVPENNSEQIEDPRKAAVAAAVARAKAKKLAKEAEQASEPENNSAQIEDPKKTAVAAAVARAKAKKLAREAEQVSEPKNESEKIEDPKKAAIAAAVARAKAKKLAKQAEQASEPENDSEQIEDPKKAAIAAAVARAKTKKLAREAEQASEAKNELTHEENNTKGDE